MNQKNMARVELVSIVVIVIIFVSLSPLDCCADTIYLNNGNELYGDIISETDTKIRLRGENFEIDIARDNIKEIKAGVYEEKVSMPAPISKPAHKSTAKPKKVKKKAAKAKPKTIKKLGYIQLKTGDFLHLGYVPLTYDDKQSYPLILGFPGSYNAPTQYLPLWVKAAERYGYIVVCLKSIDENGSWGKKDLKNVEEVLEDIRDQYHIDRKRIYLAGFSAGGQFVYRVAQKMPRTFKGLASICAYLRTSYRGVAKEVNKKFKFYILNGSIDEIMSPEEGEKSAKYLKEKGFKRVTYIKMPYTGHDQSTSIAFKVMEYFDIKER